MSKMGFTVMTPWQGTILLYKCKACMSDIGPLKYTASCKKKNAVFNDELMAEPGNF